jgi:hypothetical protein
MFVNAATRFLLIAVTYVVTPLKWVMIVPTTILLHAPLIHTVYEFLVAVTWFPFSVFITCMNWLYAGVPVVGLLLSVIGIPIVLLGYVVGLLIAPGSSEDRNFGAICRSYPFPTTVI